jgi:hypothetical protein
VLRGYLGRVNHQLLLAFPGVLFVLLLPGCDFHSPKTAHPTPLTHAAALPSERLANPFNRLLGRWERPDGGYELELASVDAEGRFTAAYFNPQPFMWSRRAGRSRRTV